MKKTALLVITAALLLVILLFALPFTRTHKSAEESPFEKATISLEYNATDDDAEIVIHASSPREGLRQLQLLSPQGALLFSFAAHEKDPLGLRHFSLETPEPKKKALLTKTYPPGDYLFRATTLTGKKIEQAAPLTHTSPAPPTIVSPKNWEKVPYDDLVIRWTNSQEPSHYRITLEQKQQESSFEAVIPGSADSFTLPKALLIPQTTYQLSIGSLAADGNSTFVEIHFYTK